MTFINKHSFKCLLGPRASNIKEIADVYFWEVNKKKHFSTSKELNQNDIEALAEYGDCNFHYLSPENTEILKRHFKTSKSKKKSIILDITNLSLSGGRFKKIRQSVNRCKKYNLKIESCFRSIDDVDKMIRIWSHQYTEKYFRDFSGKNKYFYRNNFHTNCLNIFIYNKDNLVSFGSLSPGTDQASYIIGKALYKDFPGLSEYTDITLYQIAKTKGIKNINMGAVSNKRLHFYKAKFPNSTEEIYYDGSIEV